MAKDPAFLFYSKDFYEGTRMMLPEERACYIDLLIYQHQNGGFIPNDLKRVLMYCSGCSEATLEATLEAKFKLCDKGWSNETLKRVVEDRENFTKRQSTNGAVGQFWKKSKAILTAKEYLRLREVFENQSNEEVFEKIKGLEINKATLQAMLEAMLKHLAIANAIEDVIENKDVIDLEKEKGSGKGKTFEPLSEDLIPAWELWLNNRSKKFKTENSERIARVEFLKLCGGDPETGMQIVRNSIANGWQGLFRIKQDSGLKPQKDQKSNDASNWEKSEIAKMNTLKKFTDGKGETIQPLEIRAIPH